MNHIAKSVFQEYNGLRRKEYGFSGAGVFLILFSGRR
jgi:hypothetical protein